MHGPMNIKKLESFWSCGFECFDVNFHAFKRTIEFAGKSGAASDFYSECPIFESRPLHLMSRGFIDFSIVSQDKYPDGT